MSEKHLEAGQPLPPLKDGSVRLFSMKYCTFSQRSRLVLKAKGINYEEINCSLTKKPEFLLERNPDGKVPVYEHNGEVLVGSSIICDYLDEIYPDPPLYPKDPLQKAKDKFVMETYDSKVSSIFHKFMTSGGEDEEAKIIAGLTLFDAELKKRGTPFFGGQQPGMVDYSTWPWNERLMVSDKLMNTLKAKLPDLDAYFQRMLTTPAVKAILNSKEQYQKFFESFISGNPQFDL
ncbi:pyrimidodiazepine synthase-like isoform X2 [Acanthaster planci]|uniref:Glutathione S-transferase omega n=1 Tax=Acanthaster planci TaxID=133434 RepID=A0A8B7YFZ7_ACAPL|nr:pyrimidodiazepine synthase-like isoform X2 [Acanthaster planci]